MAYRNPPVPKGFEAVPMDPDQAAALDRIARETFRRVQHLPFDTALGVLLLTGMAWGASAASKAEPPQ